MTSQPRRTKSTTIHGSMKRAGPEGIRLFKLSLRRTFQISRTSTTPSLTRSMISLHGRQQTAPHRRMPIKQNSLRLNLKPKLSPPRPQRNRRTQILRRQLLREKMVRSINGIQDLANSPKLYLALLIPEEAEVEAFR